MSFPIGSAASRRAVCLGREQIRTMESGAIVGGSSDPRAIGFEGHRILIEDLVGAIRDKRPPMIPGTEAKNAVRLILAARESAKTGRTMALGVAC